MTEDLADVLAERLALLAPEQRVRLLTGADWWALHPAPEAGLRRLVVSDGPAGARGERWDDRDPSANVPSPTSLAATWDPDRVERIGRLLAWECRRKGVDVLLAPTVNLHRTPYGGRHFECFSEDPLLTALVGLGYVRGLQRNGVGATVKHFVANDAETDRFTADSVVPERALRELYLAPFEVLVREGGAWAVMAAYNSVDGTTMTESPLLREVLQGEWGFDGVTMSDWYAARSLAAARAGLDLVMPGPTGPWGAALLRAMLDGDVPEDAVADKVLRLLRLAARVGGLDGVPGVAQARRWSDAAVAAELRDTAAASFVLLRNETVAGAPALPLDVRGLRRVAVLGPNAARARTLGGGSATVFPAYTVSPLEGLRLALGDVEIVHAPGVRASTRLPVVTGDLAVRFLDSTGAPLGMERRNQGALTWMGFAGEGIPLERIAAVEVSSVLTSERGGEYLVGGSGLGGIRVDVDGVRVVDARLVLEPGTDPAAAMMVPPQAVAPVLLEPGRTVRILWHYEPLDPTELGGSFDVAALMMQCNLAEPRLSEDEELEAALAAAREADVAVVVVGTTEEVESEGFDRTDLALPGRQDELVARVLAVNPRTVVVVNSGAPVLMPWLDDVPAVLLTWFGGQELGSALADVLLGATEPGGRLPTTWPAPDTLAQLPSPTPVDGVVRYDEGLNVGYRRFLRDGARPAAWFGEGLGYTTWECREAAVVASPPDELGEAPVAVRARVRNTGQRSGREVVQVYASSIGQDEVATPVRWLAGFAGVAAAPGEEVEVRIPLRSRAFQYWDVATSAWLPLPGEVTLGIGRHAGVAELLPAGAVHADDLAGW